MLLDVHLVLLSSQWIPISLSTVSAKYAADLENGVNTDALTEADGLLVVGFFFEVSDSF